MVNKNILACINFFFLFVILLFGRGNGDSWYTIAPLVIILTLANSYDFIFDKYQLFVTQIITFSICALVLLQLFIIVG